jgi:hypothetical protein
MPGINHIYIYQTCVISPRASAMHSVSGDVKLIFENIKVVEKCDH